METSTSSSFISLNDPMSHAFDAMDGSDSHAFLKMEGLQTSPAASDSSPQYDHRDSMSTEHGSPPPTVVVHSKPAKKRKSWGQELPEPKTNLPPRKRAKTDDEKEQRRIERIKRNRAAAHNSRERKRQETETLAVALARANAELDAYRRIHGPLPADVRLPEVTVSNTDGPMTPVPSLNDSRSSVDATSPASLLHDSLFDGNAEVSIKQEPMADPPLFPSTMSPLTAHLDPKSSSSMSMMMMSPSSSLLAPLDSTQHSAAMLCDLQCRSSLRSNSNNDEPHRPITMEAAAAAWWTRLFLSLMTLHLTTSYRTLLLALWTSSPSMTSRMMARTTMRRQQQQRRTTTTRRRRPISTIPAGTTRSSTTSSPSTTSSTTPRLSSRSSLVLAQPSSAATARSPIRRRDARVFPAAAAASRMIGRSVGGDGSSEGVELPQREQCDVVVTDGCRSFDVIGEGSGSEGLEVKTDEGRDKKLWSPPSRE